MYLGVKLKSISEYYQQQITLVIDVLFSTYYILKNEYIKISDLLNSEDYQKRYTDYLKIIDQLEKSSEGTGIYLSEQHQDMLEKHREMRMNIPKSEHLMNIQIEKIKIIMVIYKQFKKRYPVQQGDIFRNIPYLSFDLLVRIGKKGEKAITDDTEDIINEVINTGNTILVETFIGSTLCILASQDCDRENDEDLIFLLLEELKENEIKNYKDIDRALIKPTRSLYLPKIKVDEKSFGPFKANFTEPIKIPTKLIKNKLKELRIAKISDSPKKVFINKLKNFYARFQINQIIFYENEDIQDYVIIIWNKAELSEENKLEKIEEIKLILESNERSSDIKKIYFEKPVDIHYVKEIRKKLIELNFGESDSELVNICNNILKINEINLDNLKEQQHIFESLKKKLFVDDDCLVNKINSEDWIINFTNRLSDFRDDDYLKIAAEKAKEYIVAKHKINN